MTAIKIAFLDDVITTFLMVMLAVAVSAGICEAIFFYFRMYTLRLWRKEICHDEFGMVIRQSIIQGVYTTFWVCVSFVMGAVITFSFLFN